MTCPDCERYKKSAAMWRNKAYEAAGHPLPWKPDELWQGLTDEEIYDCLQERNREKPSKLVRMIAKAIEEKLMEKNG